VLSGELSTWSQAPGDAALLGVPPHTDGSSYAGFEAAGQHVGITNLFNRLNGTTGRLLRLRR
jgi:hypothetical protein